MQFLRRSKCFTALFPPLPVGAGPKKQRTGGLFETDKSGMHGFGLRRARSILEAHDGWLKVNSEDGAFTTEFLVPALP